MKEWFCPNCHTIKHQFDKKPTCCGIKSQRFRLWRHGRYLISASNSWRTVWKRWKEHPLIEEVGMEHAESGNSSAANIFNDAIARMEEEWIKNTEVKENHGKEKS